MRPFSRARNGLRWRRRSKANPFVGHRPSRDSGEANPHPDHAGARRRAEREGALKISLDVRNENLPEKRIHQICAWTPARCWGGRTLVARARLWRRACAADRRFPASRLLSHCYFSWGRSATRAAVGGSAHDRRLQEEANALETRRKSIWSRRAPALPRRKSFIVGGRPPLFFVVAYNAGCGGSCLQLQPKVERYEVTGGAAYQRKHI